jgi:hypothetical protein
MFAEAASLQIPITIATAADALKLMDWHFTVGRDQVHRTTEFCA